VKVISQPVRSRTLRTQQRAIKVNAKDFFKKSKALIDVVNFNLLKLIISFLFYKYLWNLINDLFILINK